MRLVRHIDRIFARRRFKGVTAVMAQSLRSRGHVAGVIDECRDGTVRGWVYDATRPSSIVELEVLIDGMVVATGRADHKREDLALLLHDDGLHGFEIEADALWLPANTDRSVCVRLLDKPSYVMGPVVVPSAAIDMASARPSGTGSGGGTNPYELTQTKLCGVGRFAHRSLSDAIEEQIFLDRLENAIWAKKHGPSDPRR